MTAAETLLSLSQESSDECVLWPLAVRPDGYGVLRFNGRTRRAHAVVCEVAHGPCPPGKREVAHSCRNRDCVNPAHLRWATRHENMADKVADGTACRGEDSAQSRLTEDDVRTIRRLRREGVLQREVAAMFGIAQPTVSEIDLGKIWGWME